MSKGIVTGSVRFFAAFALLATVSIDAAWGNGAGLSGHSVDGCASCHTPNTGNAFSFSTAIVGPHSLAPGEAGSFTVTMTRPSGSNEVFSGGFDLSASNGTLSSSDPDVSKFGAELVHNKKRALNGNTITWPFTWSAANPGNYTLFFCTNPVDGHNDQFGDGPSKCDTHSITVAPPPINRAPVAADDSFSTHENTALTVPAPGLLANDSDPDDDPLNAVVLSTVPATQGKVEVKPNGGFKFTPAKDFSGVASFTYRAHDATLNSTPATVKITVIHVDRPPVAVNDSYSTAEDTTLTVTPAQGLLANDRDPDGDPLSAVMFGAVPAAQGALAANANGGFTFAPASNFSGTVTFSYRTSDGTQPLSNSATVTIAITPRNDLPVAMPDSFEARQDTALNIAAPGVLGNDTDVDSNPLSASQVTVPSHGNLTLNANGSFRYTPAASFSGPDAFTYRANDGSANSNTVTVSLNVIAVVGTAPLAAADTATTDEDRVLNVPAPGVLGNDSDPANRALTAVLAEGPAHGLLVLNPDGRFRYTPEPDFNGADAFTYRANNGLENSNTATVTLTVNSIDDAPVIVSRAPAVAFDSRPFVHDVIATDVDSPTLTYSLSGAPDGMSISNAGRITWTPPSGATTSGPVTLQVGDGLAIDATQRFTLSVRPDSRLTDLADINRNRAQDLAVLVKDGSGLKLYVKDGLDGATLSTADFGTARGQAEILRLGDLDGDRRSDLAVLSRNLANGALRVDLRSSASGAAIRSFPVLSKAFEPITLASLPDLDGSGSDEIAVLGRNVSRGDTLVQIVDLGTGTALRSIAFLSRRAEPVGLVRIDDRDGNAQPELVVLARDRRTGATVVEARDASTGNLVATPRFSRKLQPLSLTVAGDLTGNGAQELVVLGRETGRGRVRVEVGDLLTGTVDRSFVFFSKRHTPLSVLLLPDQNGNQVQEVAVLAKSDNGAPEVQVLDGLSGELLSGLSFLGRTFYPSGLARTNDISGNAISELTVLGSSSNRVRSQTLDAATGGAGLTTNYP